ncbi:hypothetical protein HHI36_003424 [Cryptolaemus montrouzieri]|uniref:Uncharacterized protein n=1 Tax=Cryptolaemus montrouzieri TaxID=559131 RepID=A0ABD2PEC0_9CUCU
MRTNTKRANGQSTQDHEEYKEAKRNLTSLIEKAKAESWKRLLEEVQQDTFGLGYKIVTRKLVTGRKIDRELVKAAVAELFPCHPDFERESLPLKNCKRQQKSLKEVKR